MLLLRYIYIWLPLVLCLTLPEDLHATLTDQLEQELSKTDNSYKRVAILLNLKDLNEDTELNLPYSIQLFREAASIGDTYALTIAALPIFNAYAPYPEKEDSLRYYIRVVRHLTPDTREEGADAYLETNIGFNRIQSLKLKADVLRTAHEVISWCDSTQRSGNIYDQAKELILQGYASSKIGYWTLGYNRDKSREMGLLEQAYRLTEEMPGLLIRRQFANISYYLLSGLYVQDQQYDKLTDLTQRYISLLEQYARQERDEMRRPYLYMDNSYVMPYKNIQRCLVKMKREDLAQRNFEEFKQRMSDPDSYDSKRNRAHVYEFAYLWKKAEKEYDTAISYCDSLLRLINENHSLFQSFHLREVGFYRDRSTMLTKIGRYDDALDSYRQTSRVIDSTFNDRLRDRSVAISQNLEMNQLKLEYAQNRIRIHTGLFTALVALIITLSLVGFYLYQSLRKNRRLQRDILRHSRKAQESEQMKSLFVNTICHNISTPLNAIDNAALKLVQKSLNDGNPNVLNTLRENTSHLLSILNSILEASNLSSLTGEIELTETDVDQICRTELHEALYYNKKKEIEFSIEAPEDSYTIPTNAKYFAFVLHKLLESAIKYTQQGSITLAYHINRQTNTFHLSITDTGCGVSEHLQEHFFSTSCANPTNATSISLALCATIVKQLKGSISLDTTYKTGTRIHLTLPTQL